MNPIMNPIARAIVKSGITSDREDWLGEKFSVNSKEFTDVRATFYGLGEWTEAHPSRRRGGSARVCPRHDKASFRSPSGIVMMLTHAGETKQAAVRFYIAAGYGRNMLMQARGGRSMTIPVPAPE
jgi:hypothetical protein